MRAGVRGTADATSKTHDEDMCVEDEDERAVGAMTAAASGAPKEKGH